MSFPRQSRSLQYKYFEVVDMAHERLNERLCNKDMHVLLAI